MPKPILLIIFWAFAFSGYAQTSVSVIDSETYEPLAFVRLKGPSHQFYTNLDGETYLDSLSIGDTLVVECIGYHRKWVPFSPDLKEIKLDPELKMLKSLQVQASAVSYRKKTIGPEGARTTSMLGYLLPDTNTIAALWFHNDKGYNGFVKTIRLEIRDKGIPTAPFKVHLYECDPLDGRPGARLTQVDIRHKANGPGWTEINVEHLNIPIPVNGFFVGIQHIKVPEDQLPPLETRQVITFLKDTLELNGIVPITRSEVYRTSRNRLWKYLAGSDWRNGHGNTDKSIGTERRLPNGKKFILTENNLYLVVPSMQVEIKYNKSKGKSEYRKGRKRKLNKIDRHKQDLIKYPQSSVKELFTSVRTAFENDDWVYVLKYLCVYKEDELNEILENPELQDYFHGEEKQKLIENIDELIQGLDQAFMRQEDHWTYILTVDGVDYHLVQRKGLWSVNPYGYRVVRWTEPID